MVFKSSFQLVLILMFFILLGTSLSKDLNNWSEKQIYHTLIYHSKSSDILIFGGIPRHSWNSLTIDDIWAYDIELNLWQKVGTAPDGDFDSPAYDAGSDRVVMLTKAGET